jgi:hypothetical protein
MEGKLDGSEDHEGGQGFGEIFEVLCETPVLSELGEGALDHPAARQEDKSLHVVAPFKDLRAQRGTLASAAEWTTTRIGVPRHRPGRGPCGLSPSCRRIAHVVVSTTPFATDFTDWPSRTAGAGLAARPSRSGICSSAKIAPQLAAPVLI